MRCERRAGFRAHDSSRYYRRLLAGRDRQRDLNRLGWLAQVGAKQQHTRGVCARAWHFRGVEIDINPGAAIWRNRAARRANIQPWHIDAGALDGGVSVDSAIAIDI